MATSTLIVLRTMKSLLNIPEKTAPRTIERVVIAEFGFGPKLVAIIWNMLVERNLVPENCVVRNLLWFYAYVKSYATYELYCTKFRTTKPTFMLKVGLLSTAIAAMKDEVVSNKLFIYFFKLI